MGLVRPAKTAPKQTKRCVPHSRGTASDILEEGGDDVKSAWPLWLGHTRATMAITMGSKAVRRSESGKIASVRIVLCNSGT